MVASCVPSEHCLDIHTISPSPFSLSSDLQNHMRYPASQIRPAMPASCSLLQASILPPTVEKCISIRPGSYPCTCGYSQAPSTASHRLSCRSSLMTRSSSATVRLPPSLRQTLRMCALVRSTRIGREPIRWPSKHSRAVSAASTVCKQPSDKYSYAGRCRKVGLTLNCTWAFGLTALWL